MQHNEENLWNISKRTIKIIGASNWPWFEHFNQKKSNIAKISGIPNAIDQGVHVMNSEIELVNVNDEKDIQTPQMPNSP